ncbi:zinc-ribbon domain-containing protein [Rathayibacter sp. VKM Ac-2759]|nr:zinc-ribbon domain-containing protein [Rathayibacter sp. VKM Ac-2759]
MLIFGTRSVEDVLRVLVSVCRVCGVRAEQHVLRSRTKLSLFFVPLLTVSTRYLLECSHCGAVTRIDKEEAHATPADSRPQDARPNDA